jgi:UDP-N-acetylmuramate dehydrogenase
MIALDLGSSELAFLKDEFASRYHEGIPMSHYTSARLGGPADVLLEVSSVDELVDVVSYCWKYSVPNVLLGNGSNVLVSDAGIRALVVINHARNLRFAVEVDQPTAWAESGANLSVLSRQAARYGLTGLEWATGIPGTVGGAVVGNAGAQGRDVASCLRLVEILHHIGNGQAQACVREEWPVEKLEYSYRSSVLKRKQSDAVVLSALFKLDRSDPDTVHARMEEYTAFRKRTQPPGASIGSVFKNPPGDFAGRLIEAAGLKGVRIGNAQISPVHANFILNLGQATSADFYALIQLSRQKVSEEFGVSLELEIELLGEW